MFPDLFSMSEQSEQGLFVQGMPWNEVYSSIESALGMYIPIVEMSSLQQ